MNTGIFLDDFERTEHSDALHAIVGRALIIATKFDASRKVAALHSEIRKGVLKLRIEQDRSDLLNRVAEKYRSLKSSITALNLPKEVSVILHDANDARNSMAHDLAEGIVGCLNIKVDEASFIREVSELIFDLAYGDLVIYHAFCVLNGDPSPAGEFASSHVDRVIRWVVEK